MGLLFLHTNQQQEYNVPILSKQKISDYADEYLAHKSMQTGESKASIVRRALFDAAYKYNMAKDPNHWRTEASDKGSSGDK